MDHGFRVCHWIADAALEIQTVGLEAFEGCGKLGKGGR